MFFRTYTLVSGAWAMGRIMKNPEILNACRDTGRYTALGKPLELRTDGHTPTLEAAKAEPHGELEAVAGVGKAR